MNRSIAYIAGMFPLRSETFVYREVRALRQRGWLVAVAALHESPDAAAAGFEDLSRDVLLVYAPQLRRTLTTALAEVLRHPLRSARTLAAALADAIHPGESTRAADRLKLPAQALAALGLAGRLRTLGIEHIHCHFAHAPATIGMYAAMQLGVCFSFTGHANDLFQRRALLKRKLRRARFVACISQWHREFYSSIVHGRRRHFHVIRCGVDTGQWLARPELPPPRDRPLRLLTVCRLVEKKGVDTLLAAMAELRDRHGREAHLCVAGDGPQRPQLERLARELGLEQHVQWLGAVENERVRCLLDEADLFALPCRTDASGDRDGIPVVLMEAMARGVPVICGELPAIRELIEEGQTGRLVSGGDSSALAACINELANRQVLRQQLSVRGRQRVEQEFSLQTNITRLEQALAGSLR